MGGRGRVKKGGTNKKGGTGEMDEDEEMRG